MQQYNHRRWDPPGGLAGVIAPREYRLCPSRKEVSYDQTRRLVTNSAFKLTRPQSEGRTIKMDEHLGSASNMTSAAPSRRWPLIEAVNHFLISTLACGLIFALPFGAVKLLETLRLHLALYGPVNSALRWSEFSAITLDSLMFLVFIFRAVTIFIAATLPEFRRESR